MSQLKALRVVGKSLFVLVASLLLQGIVLAQGVHVNLVGAANPFPGTYKQDRYQDIQVMGHYAYVGQFASNTGVLIFDISNPSAPVMVTKYVTPNVSADMEYLQVGNNVGYFASGRGGGVHIVDLSNPLQPKLITRLTSANGAYDNVENTFLDGTHLYIPNYRNNSPAVEIWDVSTPSVPRLITTVMGTDPVASHDVVVVNNKMYIAGWGGHIDIWDVTNVDTQTPVLLGTFTSETHAQFMWPTADGNFLVVPHELTPVGDVRIYKVSDPTNVVQVAALTASNLGIGAVTPAEVKVFGNMAYVAWDQAGLVIFDISDPGTPVMVGAYDSFSGPNNVSFQGGIAVYPFLGQNQILLTDTAFGLFVLDATNVSQSPALYNLTMTPSSIPGGLSSTGNVFLVGIAQSGGLPVTISGTGPAASGSVVVPVGATSAKFSEHTTAVTSNMTAVVTASDGTYSASANLTVTPPTVSGAAFSPSKVTGGSNTNFIVTLNVAPIVDTTIPIAVVSGGTAVASIPASVTVTAGSTQGSVVVATNSVSTQTTVQVSATLNGKTKTGSLTVQ
jgi:hypothetical protein